MSEFETCFRISHRLIWSIHGPGLLIRASDNRIASRSWTGRNTSEDLKLRPSKAALRSLRHLIKGMSKTKNIKRGDARPRYKLTAHCSCWKQRRIHHIVILPSQSYGVDRRRSLIVCRGGQMLPCGYSVPRGSGHQGSESIWALMRLHLDNDNTWPWKDEHTVLPRPPSQLKPRQPAKLEGIANDGPSTRPWREPTFRRSPVQSSDNKSSDT